VEKAEYKKSAPKTEQTGTKQTTNQNVAKRAKATPKRVR
jgi:hypothetical protein